MIKQYSELDDEQKVQVIAQFSSTLLFDKTFDNYVYEVGESGSVISRKSRAEYERENSLLVKRQPKEVPN
jgi:hypothetical protein